MSYVNGMKPCKGMLILKEVFSSCRQFVTSQKKKGNSASAAQCLMHEAQGEVHPSSSDESHFRVVSMVV